MLELGVGLGLGTQNRLEVPPLFNFLGYEPGTSF
jgi:hypothetical protein